MMQPRFWFALVCLAVTAAANGHATSTSYLMLDAQGALTIEGTWDVAVADLHWTLDLDADNDGGITWSEIQTRFSEISQLAGDNLALARDGAPCRVMFSPDALLAEHAGEPHVSLSLAARCPQTGALSISGSLFFDQDASQRMLLDVKTARGSSTVVLAPSNARWNEPQSQSLWHTFAAFVPQGAWHVWIGYDHVAFVLLLLLASVRSASSANAAAAAIFKVVTAFTVAHSITLGLATTGWIQLPGPLVELTIAASIVIAALMNLRPGVWRGGLWLAFGFGLVHGFGFANALAELGSLGGGVLPALAGFNIGVELAQLGIVLVVLPVLLLLRRSPFYADRLLPATSLAMAFAGAAWLIERL